MRRIGLRLSLHRRAGVVLVILCCLGVVSVMSVAVVVIAVGPSYRSGTRRDGRPVGAASPAGGAFRGGGASAVGGASPVVGASPVGVAVSFTRAFVVQRQAGTAGWRWLVTPALLARLSDSPGDPVGETQLRGVGPIRVVAVRAAVDDRAPGAAGVSTVAALEIGAGDHAASLTEYVDLLLVSTPAGWKVSEVDL